MVDVNPQDTRSRYAPRQADLVDAVAAARRVSDQAMRANPVEDALVTQGLTRFRGNYGGEFAWFGEFLPYDQNLLDEFGNRMPQRGISFVRDDPQGNSAFAMYDWNPQAGVPLRQRIVMHDADGRVILREGNSGGVAFPDTAIVMYQRETIDPTGSTISADATMYSGSGNLTGNRLDFQGAWATTGTITVSTYLKVTAGSVTITTPTSVLVGPQNYFLDIDIDTVYDAGDFVNVEWHAWRSAGTGAFFPRMYRCRAYSL